MRGLLERIERDGFALFDAGLADSDLARLTTAMDGLATQVDLGAHGGVRNALCLVPEVGELATSAPLWRLASAVLGRDCAAVRAIIFDKTPSANWKVSWHQDLTIAVRRRVEAPGYGPWSEKAGIPHVQPPLAVLERMLTLRVHLDPCGSSNGPLRVLAGSHRSGRLSSVEIDQWRRSNKAVACLAARGEILAMRPLLLHASSPAESPVHRRVIHLEYAAGNLATGLEWYEAWRRAAHVGAPQQQDWT